MPSPRQPDDAVKAPSPAKLREDAALQQQILSRQFAQFEQDLHKLILKLKRSTKEEDRLRAEVLEKVLDRAKNNLISVQFEVIVQQLKEQQLRSTGEIKIAAERSVKLADELRELIALLREDPRQSKVREERLRLEALLKELDGIIHKQKVAQGITDGNKTDKAELAKIQNKVTKQTAEFGKKLEGKAGEGQAKDAKGDPKEGGKDAGKAGPSKDVGKESPKSEAKPGGDQVAKAELKEPKPGSGEPKEPKPGDKQVAAAKPGDKAEPGAKSKSGDAQARRTQGGRAEGRQQPAGGSQARRQEARPVGVQARQPQRAVGPEGGPQAAPAAAATAERPERQEAGSGRQGQATSVRGEHRQAEQSRREQGPGRGHREARGRQEEARRAAPPAARGGAGAPPGRPAPPLREDAGHADRGLQRHQGRRQGR